MVNEVHQVIKNIRDQLNILESMAYKLDGNAEAKTTDTKVDLEKQGELLGFSKEVIQEYLYGDGR